MPRGIRLPVLAGLAPLGCVSIGPIYSPLPIAVLGGMTAPKVSRAVLRALPKRGWTVVQAVPGLVIAQTRRALGVAVVAIVYDARFVRVRYRSSECLDYEMKRGTACIHKHYNAWIHSLVDDIRAQLSSYVRQHLYDTADRPIALSRQERINHLSPENRKWPRVRPA